MDVCFPRRQHSVPLRILAQEILFPFFYEVIFIDKTNLHAVRHFIAFRQNIISRLALIRTSRKTDFRWRDITKNNFSVIDISWGLDLEPRSLSPYFLLKETHRNEEWVAEPREGPSGKKKQENGIEDEFYLVVS